MRRRNHIHKHARETGDEDLWSLYRHLRNEVTSKLRKQRRDFFKDRRQEHPGKPKHFWKTLRLVLPGKSKAKNIDKLVIGNEDVHDPKIIANKLNSHSVSIAESVLNESYPSINLRVASTAQEITHNDIEFTFEHVSNEDVYKALISLKTTKAIGVDDILAKASKAAAGQLAPSIAYLFNVSWDTGIFPSDWNIARVFSSS